MIRQLAVLCATFGLLTSAAAQMSGDEYTRRAMFDAAGEVYRSVEAGGGFVGANYGVDRTRLLAHAFDGDERENWQFWPTGRVGLPLEYMTAAERRATHDLLAATLSSQGYLKAVHIMQLEQILDVLDEGGFPRSVDHYVLAIFGEPSLQSPWAWRFEGHHVSLSVTVTPGGVAVTPSFFGSNPAQVLSGPLAGFRVHGGIEDLARELVASLNAEQRAVAVVAAQAPREIATANLNKSRSEWGAWITTVEPIGVEVSALNEMQQHWVDLILDEIVGNYGDSIQQTYRASIDPTAFKFAWLGGIERGEPHYFRLQGADFIFEYDNAQNGGNHVHSVWRSKGNDFGANLLAEHYAAEH